MKSTDANASNRTIPADVPENTPFSLTCIGCDAGGDIASIDDAINAGWRAVDYDDGPWWNFIGCCPDCAPGYYGDDLPPLGWAIE